MVSECHAPHCAVLPRKPRRPRALPRRSQGPQTMHPLHLARRCDCVWHTMGNVPAFPCCTPDLLCPPAPCCKQGCFSCIQQGIAVYKCTIAVALLLSCHPFVALFTHTPTTPPCAPSLPRHPKYVCCKFPPLPHPNACCSPQSSYALTPLLRSHAFSTSPWRPVRFSAQPIECCSFALHALCRRQLLNTP